MEKSNTIQFAHGVNDSMSFSEAFATARQEVGPGGAFVWRGTVYGTYYGSEWNAMSSSEQHAFTSNAVNAYHNQDNHEEIASVKENEPASNNPQEEYSVNVIEVEPDYVLPDGTHVGMGIVEIDGIVVVYIDLDQDGIYDISMVDENGNGDIEENEIYLETSGISANDLQLLQMSQQGEAGHEEHHVPEGVEVVTVVKDVQITEDGDIGDVGIANIEGVETVLIDVDQNGTFDVAMGDFNRDGVVSEEEMVYVTNPELTVQNFQQELQAQNGVDNTGNLVAYHNTPDYSTQADAADFDNHVS